jgi:hypothetical protein
MARQYVRATRLRPDEVAPRRFPLPFRQSECDIRGENGYQFPRCVKVALEQVPSGFSSYCMVLFITREQPIFSFAQRAQLQSCIFL